MTRLRKTGSVDPLPELYFGASINRSTILVCHADSVAHYWMTASNSLKEISFLEFRDFGRPHLLTLRA